jgi:hypothetical protein
MLRTTLCRGGTFNNSNLPSLSGTGSWSGTLSGPALHSAPVSTGAAAKSRLLTRRVVATSDRLKNRKRATVPVRLRNTKASRG